jgi:UDP-N-acetylglucosamine acyltransferase
MPIRPSARVHPTAVISPEAELADDVQVGPFVVIEGLVRLGPGCVIRPYAHLIGPLTMGRGNKVYGGAVIGERPQHTRYNDEPTSVEVGDENVFREHVTVHRGTTQSWKTVIGSRNFFMAGAHVAHDCRVGNGCILANGSLLGGHCVIEDGAYLSGNSAVHQFVRVGRLAMLGGASGSSKDIPPFVIQQYINTVCGVNVVGMRRAGLSSAQIDAVRRAYHIIFREGRTMPNALAQAETELGSADVVRELVDFIRHSARGVSAARDRGHDTSARSMAA